MYLVQISDRIHLSF